MSNFFEFLELEQREERMAERRAAVMAKARVDNQMGDFLRTSSTNDEFEARAELVSEDFENIVLGACREANVERAYSSVYKAVLDQYVPAAHVAKVASIQHEARKPKMCPYHSEVTAISLAQGEPQAGYSAMAQHAWSDKHCQGTDYDGAKCNFKPEMTTQSYWDEKAEKAEERKQQRAEEAQQQQVEQEHIEEITTPVDEPVEEVAEEPADNVVDVDFGSPEPVSDTEVPMAMAASFQEPRTAEYKYVKQRGDKWVIVQKGTGKVLSTHDSKEQAEAAFRAMEMNMHGGKVADTDVTGLGGPEPKIDKRKWTPETVKKIDVDDANGRWPTKTVDPLVPIVDENRDKLEQIGENTTEHQNLPSSDNGGFETKKNVDNGSQGGTFPNRNQTKPVS